MRKLRNEELNRLSLEDYKEIEKSPITIVLDNVRSLNNIGSVFRTADGFRIERVILCGISTCPPHREIHKTALGAEESVLWDYHEDTSAAISGLHEEGYTLIAVEQAEHAIQLCDFEAIQHGKMALIFGHEVKGVQQAVVDECDVVIEIPQYGTKHSFNISVSVGIVLWEVFRQLH